MFFNLVLIQPTSSRMKKKKEMTRKEEKEEKKKERIRITKDTIVLKYRDSNFESTGGGINAWTW